MLCFVNPSTVVYLLKRGRSLFLLSLEGEEPILDGSIHMIWSLWVKMKKPHHVESNVVVISAYQQQRIALDIWRRICRQSTAPSAAVRPPPQCQAFSELPTTAPTLTAINEHAAGCTMDEMLHVSSVELLSVLRSIRESLHPRRKQELSLMYQIEDYQKKLQLFAFRCCKWNEKEVGYCKNTLLVTFLFKNGVRC